MSTVDIWIRFPLSDIFIKMDWKGSSLKESSAIHPFGYSPDVACLRPIWKYANDQKLPVISHCMHSAMTWNTNIYNGYGADRKTLESSTAPSAYVEVLRNYTDMKLCLAHFGGNQEWDVYLKSHNWEISDNLPEHTLDMFPRMNSRIRIG